jgi:hypothetical protein
MGDMHAEHDLYRKSNALVELLSTWTSDRSTMQGWMEHLWSEMYARGYIEIEDVELVQLWLQELTSSGNSFPCINDQQTVIPHATNKAFQDYTPLATEPQRATVPLQGWYLKGGQSKTVQFLREESAADRLSSGKTVTYDYAKMCSEHCENDVRCIAWSFGPQKAHDGVMEYDVNCSNNSSTLKKCRCVLHGAARGMLAYSEQHAIIGVQPEPDDAKFTYSGVIQRDIIVYTGKPPDATQPNRILLIVNFFNHIKKETLDFMIEQLYPQCLPAGFDIVIVGPQSGISGVLLNPWSNKGHFAGLAPTLAYTRFPNYDGK